MKKQYGNESISSLKGADRVRKRPGVIFGSDGIEGCQHSVFEIVSNSIDEAREGFGSVINVTYFEDNSIEVEDFARGIPLEYNEKEKRFNWELVFCEMYAGGKYENSAGSHYQYSLGLNGLGSCATQYASRYMDVTVWSGGFEYNLHFERGENIGGLKKEPSTRKKSGSRIKWMPDLDVFTDINIAPDYFTSMLKKQAVVNAGLKFQFKYSANGQRLQETYLYEDGIVDYAKELMGETPLSGVHFAATERVGRDREDKDDYTVKMQTAFVFTNDNVRTEYYHNSSFLEHGGAPDKAAKSALVSAMDAYLRNNNKYTKNESKISYVDIFDSLILVTNSFSTQTSYENQTKKSITNKFIQEAMTDFLRAQMEVFLIENKAQAERVAEQILINKRSRETAERTKLNLKKKLTGTVDIANRVQKFVDCRTKDVDQREIYIVEGDSALGACKQARDAEFQAIIPVRGKILNCLKADYDKIFKNEIITDLIKVLGCGVEVKTKNKDMTTFDLDALRWNKVIICTDADVDGFQIRTLILAMLYRLVPTLIEEGFVYIAESPLYEITAKNKTYFAYSDGERDSVLSKLEGQKVIVQRSKGLGENEPDMMSETTMSPATRRLIKIEPEEAARTAEYFDLFLGDNLQGRKDFIVKYGQKYLDLADIS